MYVRNSTYALATILSACVSESVQVRMRACDQILCVRACVSACVYVRVSVSVSVPVFACLPACISMCELAWLSVWSPDCNCVHMCLLAFIMKHAYSHRLQLPMLCCMMSRGADGTEEMKGLTS